jgi:hypothetical protein
MEQTVSARHRTLDNLAHRLDRAANIVPEVLDHLDEQRANVTPIQAQDTRGNIHIIGAVSNPTLATVQQLDSIEYRRREIHDHIATLELAVKLLEQACRRALAYRAGQSDSDDAHLADEPRCISCNQIPTLRTSRDGLTIDDGRCLDCGQRHDRDEAERIAQRRIDADSRRARRYGRV